MIYYYITIAREIISSRSCELKILNRCLIFDFRGFPFVRRRQRWFHNPRRDVQHRRRYISDGGE